MFSRRFISDCLGLSSLSVNDEVGIRHAILNGTYLFRVWFLNHPEQDVNMTFNVDILSCEFIIFCQQLGANRIHCSGFPRFEAHGLIYN